MKIYKKILVLVAYLWTASTLLAQSVGDFGVVWKYNDYTANKSSFSNIIPQSDGTYLACGIISGIDANNRNLGYVVQINELGQKLDEWILTPPNVDEWTAGSTTANAQILRAFIGQDKALYAFGHIFNTKAAKKGNDFGNNNMYLLNGIWMTKLDSNKNVLVNKMGRGSILYDVKQYTNGSFLINGMDSYNLPSFTTLFRHYDSSLSLVFDYQNYLTATSQSSSIPVWTNKLNFDLSNPASIIMSSTEGATILTTYTQPSSSVPSGKVVKNKDLYKTVTYSDPNTCITKPSTPPPGKTWGAGPTSVMTVLSDGSGVWATGRMNYYVDNTGAGYAYGSYFALKNSNDAIVQCNVITNPSVNQTISYGIPYSLPGSSLDYVGSVNKSGVNYMYKVTKTATGFTLEDSNIQMPYNTSISAISHTDGLFACGRDPITQTAAITKLTTCAFFKVTSLPDDMVILDPYNPILNVSIPIDFQGQKGNVSYYLKAVVKDGIVDGKIAGEELSTENGTLATGATTFDINKTYNLSTTYAIIEYTLNIKDTYTISGTQQTCGQTYIFRVMTVPQTDVVAMPTRVNDGTKNIVKTSIKNIGEGLFDNYKITIYDSTLGNATKYTYTHSGSIAPNETLRLEIDLTGTAVANSTNLVVSFNDSGAGIQNQTEQSDKQFSYTIN